MSFWPKWTEKGVHLLPHIKKDPRSRFVGIEGPCIRFSPLTITSLPIHFSLVPHSLNIVKISCDSVIQTVVRSLKSSV